MNIDRHKLHFGPYRTPCFKYGAKVECEVRGEVTIWKLTAARIPWPIGKTHRATSLVLYKDLARAVRLEAACDVAYWWGVGPSTVNKWRRALGVPAMNEGDRRRKQRFAKTDAFKADRAKAWIKARIPTAEPRSQPPSVASHVHRTSTRRCVEQTLAESYRRHTEKN
jgi:hypothetical protein